MKKLKFAALVITFSTILASCDTDPCDPGYTEIDDGICLPDHVVGIEKNKELGNVFYHKTYGVIKFENGKWFTENNRLIESLNN